MRHPTLIIIILELFGYFINPESHFAQKQLVYLKRLIILDLVYEIDQMLLINLVKPELILHLMKLLASQELRNFSNLVHHLRQESSNTLHDNL